MVIGKIRCLQRQDRRHFDIVGFHQAYDHRQRTGDGRLLGSGKVSKCNSQFVMQGRGRTESGFTSFISGAKHHQPAIRRASLSLDQLAFLKAIEYAHDRAGTEMDQLREGD